MIAHRGPLPSASVPTAVKKQFADFFRNRPALVQAVRSFFLKLGLDVHRTPPSLFDLLRTFDIRTVLDVGANIGQFAHEIRTLIPGAIIHSFEPNPEPYAALRLWTEKDPLFNAYRMALGESDEVRELEVNSLGPSSSLLPLNDMATYRPEMEIVKRIKVPVQTLDSWADNKELESPILLKLDVQGLEAEVIRGGLKTLPKVSVAVLEVSFQPLYLGQPLYDEIHHMMYAQGFSMQGLYSISHDHHAKRQLWGDALFVRRDWPK